MGDRFTRGLVAGIVAGVIPFVINWGAFALNFSTLRWSEFMGLFIFGSKPAGTGETIFAIVAQFILLGVFGVVFAFLIQLFSRVNYWLKGLTYGIIIWFFVFFIVHLFEIPEFARIPLNTAITNAIAGLLWGLTLSTLLNWLDHRVKT